MVGASSSATDLPIPYLAAVPQYPNLCAILEAYFILPKLSAISFPAFVFKGFCFEMPSVIFLKVPGVTFLTPQPKALTSLPPNQRSIPN